MFRTNNCLSTGGYFSTHSSNHIVSAAKHPQIHSKILYAACTEITFNLLMMNNYLFETCRGQFNWNKLMRKSVHHVGYSHVYVSRCTVQRMWRVFAVRFQVRTRTSIPLSKTPFQWATLAYALGRKGGGVKRLGHETDLHLMPRLRLSRALSPLLTTPSWY
jgi:hypothetical protein